MASTSSCPTAVLCGRKPALEIVRINNRTRLRIQPFVPHVPNDADDVKQLQIPVHVTELDLPAQRPAMISGTVPMFGLSIS